MRTGKSFTHADSKTMTTIAPGDGGGHLVVTDRARGAAMFGVLDAAQLRELAAEALAIADEIDPPAPPPVPAEQPPQNPVSPVFANPPLVQQDPGSFVIAPPNPVIIAPQPTDPAPVEPPKDEPPPAA